MKSIQIHIAKMKLTFPRANELSNTPGQSRDILNYNASGFFSNDILV